MPRKYKHVGRGGVGGLRSQLRKLPTTTMSSSSTFGWYEKKHGGNLVSRLTCTSDLGRDLGGGLPLGTTGGGEKLGEKEGEEKKLLWSPRFQEKTSGKLGP